MELEDLNEPERNLCEVFLHHENIALVSNSVFMETCMYNQDAKCQLRTVDEPLISTYIALGLQKSNIHSKQILNSHEHAFLPRFSI